MFNLTKFLLIFSSPFSNTDLEAVLHWLRSLLKQRRAHRVVQNKS